MPPKCKFTRETIIAAALEITREGGADALTARRLAEKLESSAKPIFGLFRNMEEVQGEVLKSAHALYQSYLEKDMAAGQYPPYKASGMAYIRFAREERELFRLLFMRNRSEETREENREEIRPILSLIMQNLGLSEDLAYRFHMELWIYVHGIATMIATSYLDWEPDFISDTLSDIYNGLKAVYCGQ